MKLPWKPSHRRRGAGILTVLIASTLLMLLAFTVAGTSFHHLNLSNRLHNTQVARNLAEAALGQAVAELMGKYDKYRSPSLLTGFPAIPGPALDSQSGGFLAFDQDEVNTINTARLKQLRLDQSVNNFGSDTVLTVAGRTLPGESAYLQAVGRYRGSERAFECMLYIPKYPWAIAAGGDVKIMGQSRIASVKDIADASDPSKELPGHVLTNSISGDSALLLEGDQITVTGDVQSSSGANLGLNLVRGEKRLHSNQAPIPTIDITSYDTSTRPDVTRFNSSNGPNEITGFAYRDGSLNFPNGLKLTGGILYVKGPITISGQVSGEGAIISTGSVSITNAGGQLASNNKVAILAKGDLTMHGSSATDRRLLFNGVVYSEGRIDSEYTNIFGNTVSPSPSGIVLKDSNLYSMDGSKDLNFSVTSPGAGGGGSSNPPSAEAVAAFGKFYSQLPITTFISVGGSYRVVTFDPKISLGLNPSLSPYTPNPNPRFIDSTTNKVSMRRYVNDPLDINNQPLPPGIYTSREGGPAGSYFVPAPSGTSPISASDIQVRFGSTTMAWSNLDMAAVRAHVLAQINALSPSPNLTSLPSHISTTLDSYLNTNQLSSRWGSVTQIINSAVAGGDSRDPGVPGSTGGDPGSGQTTTVKVSLNSESSLNMSQFIARAEKVRVLYWREVVR